MTGEVDVRARARRSRLGAGDDVVTAVGAADDVVDGGDGTDSAGLGDGTDVCVNVKQGPC